MDNNFQQKYSLARHHAWAGTALLAILMALRVFINLPVMVTSIAASVIIIYILVSLVYTYRFHFGLTEKPTNSEVNMDQEKVDAKKEKERLKLEKKKAKIELKARKKGNNNA